eukprot:scaffold38032_cov72-Phaeocystis_antarctica.AAC.2
MGTRQRHEAQCCAHRREQLPHAGRLVGEDGHEQRRAAVAHRSVDTRARGEEHRCAARVAALTRHPQRRGAVAVGLVNLEGERVNV